MIALAVPAAIDSTIAHSAGMLSYAEGPATKA